MHLCPMEVAEAAVREVNIGWIADNMYLKPLLLGQVEPIGKQCTGVMGSGVLSPTQEPCVTRFLFRTFCSESGLYPTELILGQGSMK